MILRTGEAALAGVTLLKELRREVEVTGLRSCSCSMAELPKLEVEPDLRMVALVIWGTGRDMSNSFS